MRKPYPTDRSVTEWICSRSYLPTPKAQGRPRTHSLRDVLDAIFYVLKSAVLGDFCPTTSLLGLPFTTTSENCALAGRARFIRDPGKVLALDTGIADTPPSG